MKSVRFNMAEIKQRIQMMKSLTATTANSTGFSIQTKYECPECKDTGYIIKVWEGPGLATECPCLEQKRLVKRFKSAMIPGEFEDATFEGYKVENPAQKKLYDAAREYLEEFGQETGKGKNLGFIAVYGESRLKALPASERMQAKRKHNNFGLGKTHLQIAVAKELINRGVAVLCVSDVALMDELMNLRQLEDKTEFNKRIHDIIHVPVLVWDDIGKANPTEAKRSMYFHIINERYKAQRPILFSSNEDAETLSDRIGDAAASRLLGMSWGRLVAVEGPDYRLGGKTNGRTA